METSTTPTPPVTAEAADRSDVKTLIDNLNITADDKAAVNAIVVKMQQGQLDADTIATIAQGITHHADVQNADAQGYLRGKNEQIEALAQFAQDDEASEPVNFPRYARRSVWDR